MTAAELDELEALANAATPGPWKPGVLKPGICAWIDSACGTVIDVTESPPEGMAVDDANFIAAARDAVPKLIARVRELEREMSSSRECSCDSCQLEQRVRELEEALDDPPCDHCNNCDEGCWGPRRESMQDRGSRALRGRIA